MPPSEKLFRSLLKKGRGTEQLNRRFQFHKSRQQFIGAHNVTLSVIAVLHPQSRLFFRGRKRACHLCGVSSQTAPMEQEIDDKLQSNSN